MSETIDGILRNRFPSDGDVERWVREGPPGHVNYEGGAMVEWAPGWVEPGEGES